MKKLLTVFLIFFGLLFFVFTIEIRNLTYSDKVLYNNVTSISVVVQNELSQDEILKHLRYVQETYNTYIAKYVSKNFNDTSIYSTDVTLNDKIKLKNGTYPKQINRYISNIPSNEKNQVGEFYYFTTNSFVSIFPIDNLKTIDGFSGIFFINTTEPQKVNEIINYFNENIGITELYSIYGNSNYLLLLIDSIQSSIPLVILLLIFCVIFFLIIIRFSISQCKMNAIMNLHGYSLFKICKYYLKQLIEVGTVSTIVTSIFILLYLVSRFDIYYSVAFIIWNLFFQVFFLFLGLILLIILAFFENCIYKKSDILNGKKPFAVILIFQACLKYSILIFAVISFVLLQDNQVDLQKKLSVNDTWNQTQNIYRIQARFITNDMSIKRELEKKAFNFYNDIITEKDIFLIRANNYDTLLDGRHIYDANNPNGGTSIYSPKGKSIIVNENYLKRHNVYTPEHINVTKKILYNPYVMNILVPNALKQYENEIYQNFLEGFAFRKITVPNIYNEKFKRPMETTTIDDLSINIVYVEDNVNYFTYNPEIEVKNQNQVVDPIVIVDTGNFDSSFYFSYLTNSCFFDSTSVNPADEILPYSQKYQLSSVYDSVAPIYSIRAHDIQEIKKEINMLILIELALIAGFIFSIYMFCACYYNQYKYSIYVKRIFGHSILKINGKILFANALATTLVLIPFPINLFIKLFIVLLDIILMIIFNITINKSSFQQVVKGEH